MKQGNRKLPFSYPANPPTWLAQWPFEAEIKALFSEGIRRYCARILSTESRFEITWDDEHLILKIGSQQANWRLQGQRWRRSCSCGYRDDCCAHLYAGARVFEQILACEGWQSDDIDTTTAQNAMPIEEQSPAEPRRDRSPGHLPATEPEHPRIEVEIDFKLYDDDVAVRFYLNRDGRRELLRMQQVLNFGLKAQRQQAAREHWDSKDAAFLIWLSNQIRKHVAVQQNLSVLRVQRHDFEYWQEHWHETPGRFIERDSQAPLQQGTAEAKLFFELHDQGEWVQIRAVVCTPEGICRQFHEIYEMLAAGKRELVLEGAMLTFEPPVSWELLRDVFAKRAPRMRREHICEYLPTLLEGRLDIVQGPAVQRQQETGRITITAQADGADIILWPRIAGMPIRPDSSVAADKIRQDKDVLILVNYTAPEMQQVRAFLSELELEPVKDGGLRLSGRYDNVKTLVSGWHSLPPGIEKKCAAKLQALLEKDVQLQPLLNLSENRNFVDLQLHWQCDGITVNDAELRQALQHKQELLRTRRGEWLHLDQARMQTVRDTFAEFGFSEIDTIRRFRPESGKLLSALSEKVELTFTRAAVSLAERLQSAAEPMALQIPADLQSVLRSYQKHGFAFLNDRCSYQVGPVLADDMGLGKTVQVLALLSAAKAAGKPDRRHDWLALVLCPASVVSVWLDEVLKFCPELRAVAYTGNPPERNELLVKHEADILITTYAILRNDIDQLVQPQFEYVIADEAQLFKNPHSLTAKTVKSLNTPHPVALTGTPLENRLLDLWSIMDFVNPGFLGSEEAFLDRYERGADTAALTQRIAPVILRRTKQAVAPELPSRTEEVIKVEMLPKQRELYDAEIAKARENLRRKGPMEILTALMRLRQICCHPQLALKQPGRIRSAKLQTAKAMIQEILDEGHSVILFSQFTQMLDLIENECSNFPMLKITGSTPQQKRAEQVRAFQESSESKLFLLSLRAAGTGLTLTKAEYVFIFDPWWNPAVERQAIDRTHRIGQQNPVIAYRLVAMDSVEEKVLKLQAEKAELFDEVMQESTALPSKLTEEDLASLLE